MCPPNERVVPAGVECYVPFDNFAIINGQVVLHGDRQGGMVDVHVLVVPIRMSPCPATY